MKNINLILSLVTLLFAMSACEISEKITEVLGAEVLECDIDDITLSDIREGVDYIVECDVSVDGVMTIEPGVTIEFRANTALEIQNDGAIIAVGTASEPISFIGENSSRGFWRGLGVRSSDARNELSHVIITDAGSDILNETWSDVRAAVSVLTTTEDARLSIQNTEIANSAGYGLAVDEDASLIAFADNTIRDNSLSAVLCDANTVSKIEGTSSFSGNDFDGIEISSSTLDESGTQAWPKLDYKMNGDIKVETALDISAGTRLFFEPRASLVIFEDGTLIAAGNAENPIIFTGMNTSIPSWKGIVIRSSDPRNLMRHCEVSYGGSEESETVWAGGVLANILLTETTINSRLTIENSTISDTNGCGIYVSRGATLDATDLKFSNVETGDICEE